jgi:prevent-host-death family protein
LRSPEKVIAETKVSIGQVKRDISELVNRVAYGHERFVFTSRGKPKAALVSIDDYERLQDLQRDSSDGAWQKWMEESAQLSADILAWRKGKLIDADALWEKSGTLTEL